MKPLDPQLRSLLQELNTADTPAPDVQQRVWQLLAPRLNEPLPPTAESAQAAMHAGAGLAAPTSPVLVKLVIGAVLLGAPALGVMYYGAASRDRARHTTTEAAPPIQQTTPDAHETQPPSAAETAEPPSSLLEETRLLGEAQQALRRRTPKAALRWVDEHAARFPQGTLTQQREAARVIALCDLDRAAQARAAQAAFLHNWPDSPLTERVRHACTRP